MPTVERRRKMAQHPVDHSMGWRGKIKNKVSRKVIVSFSPFPLCAVTNVITTVLLLLLFSTVIVTQVPGALAFLPTTRSSANNYSKRYVGRAKRFLDERGSVKHTEWSSEADCLKESKSTENEMKSRIKSIRCENFAGMTNGNHGESLEDENVIVLNFDETTVTPSSKIDEGRILDGDRNDGTVSGGNLVSVTGETGSGKSLLVTKIADLLTGGKASVFLIHSPRDKTNIEEIDNEANNSALEIPPLYAATAEIVLSLHNEMHVSFVSKTLRRMNLDPTTVMKQSGDLTSKKKLQDNGVTLKLKRVISMTSMSTNKKNRNEGGTPKKQRIKSTCFINDHCVSLKILKAIASPLITIVNAPIAAISLGRPPSRLSMIDSGISLSVLSSVQQRQKGYRECKQYRESLEKEIERQLLPASIVRRDINGGREDEASSSASDNNQQLELLRHWIDELDGFEQRISDLQESLRSTKETSTEELDFLLCDFNGLDWTSGLNHDNRCEVGDAYTSHLYEKLLDLHDYLKLLDGRIVAALEARESLASLSASDSARVALDRTRQLLLDAAAMPQQRNGDNHNMSKSKSITCTNVHSSVKTRVSVANEKAHEMLNLVEDAISECANFLDDDEKGLLSTLQASRRSCSTPTEKILEYITEWNTLARKHGVSPNQLPLCHDALKKELDGGVEAGRLLPEAKIAEKESLNKLKEGCRVLTEARRKLCQQVSTSISRRLPRLGMENSKFEARLCPIDNPSYSKSHLGADEIDFYLIHGDRGGRTSRNDNSIRVRTGLGDQTIDGKIEDIASSGEKARLLLAIECEIPGSISSIGRDNLIGGEEDLSLHVSPVAVIYDEIDAHLGGRASISVAQMLFDQSKSCQVLSITHSPSLAAIADTHICVHRGKSDRNGNFFDVVANRVEGLERRKELGRMASGDMVVDEAEVFADALLRDASSMKTRIPNIES